MCVFYVFFVGQIGKCKATFCFSVSFLSGPIALRENVRAVKIEGTLEARDRAEKNV
jgi:hypothetical protein